MSIRSKLSLSHSAVLKKLLFSCAFKNFGKFLPFAVRVPTNLFTKSILLNLIIIIIIISPTSLIKQPLIYRLINPFYPTDRKN